MMYYFLIRDIIDTALFSESGFVKRYKKSAKGIDKMKMNSIIRQTDIPFLYCFLKRLFSCGKEGAF